MSGWYRPRTCGAGSRGSASRLDPGLHAIRDVIRHCRWDALLRDPAPPRLDAIFASALGIRARSGAKAGALAYNGRCKFPNKVGIYGSYGRSYKYPILGYQPSLKAW